MSRMSMRDGIRTGASTLLNLEYVERRDRTAVWSRAIPALFPGLTVDEFYRGPFMGVVKRRALGSIRFWEIDSGPVNVRYSPREASPKNLQAFSLMLQLLGETDASQNGRTCTLKEGDLCLIDNDSAFGLQVGASHSKILVIHVPRSAVLKCHPHFQRMTAVSISLNEEAGPCLLKRTLLAILEAAPRLSASQQWCTLSMLIHSLGLLELPDERGEILARRLRRALSVIEARLSDRFLTADDVALEQSLSRRQLDRLFKKELGVTVTSELWERRLQHAKALLQAREAGPGVTVTQIALACGFQNASHFSRIFKKRFGTQPSKWHALMNEADAGLPHTG